MESEPTTTNLEAVNLNYKKQNAENVLSRIDEYSGIKAIGFAR